MTRTRVGGERFSAGASLFRGRPMRFIEYIKHRLAVSDQAETVQRLRSLILSAVSSRQRELSVLRCERDFVLLGLARLIEPASNCVEVGARLGYFTSHLRRLSPEGELRVIEHDPLHCDWIARRVPDVTASCVDLNAPLDALIAPTTRIDFIRIEQEGGARNALLGARQILQRHRPIVLFNAPPVSADQHGDIYELFLHRGYDVVPALHMAFNREAVTKETFNAFRTYPFLGFQFFALPR